MSQETKPPPLRAVAKTEQPLRGVEFIETFARGELDSELGKEITTLAQNLRAEALSRGKKGSAKGKLTITIKLSAEVKGESDVVVDSQYDLKREDPKPYRKSDLHFVGSDGKLVREMPRQQRIFDNE